MLINIYAYHKYTTYKKKLEPVLIINKNDIEYINSF